MKPRGCARVLAFAAEAKLLAGPHAGALFQAFKNSDFSDAQTLGRKLVTDWRAVDAQRGSDLHGEGGEAYVRVRITDSDGKMAWGFAEV